MSKRRDLSDLLTPWRKSLRTTAAFIAAVAGLPRRVPFCLAGSSLARTRSQDFVFEGGKHREHCEFSVSVRKAAESDFLLG